MWYVSNARRSKRAHWWCVLDQKRCRWLDMNWEQFWEEEWLGRMEGQRIDDQGPAEREATPNARGGRKGFISLEIKKKPPMESCWSTNFVRHFHVPWLFWLRHFLVPLSAIGELAEPCLFLLSLYLTLTFSSRLTLLRRRWRPNFFHNVYKFCHNTQHRYPRISLLKNTFLKISSD